MSEKRRPPVSVPLPFERFVEGVLKIDPKDLKASKTPQVKSAPKKKPGKGK